MEELLKFCKSLETDRLKINPSCSPAYVHITVDFDGYVMDEVKPGLRFIDMDIELLLDQELDRLNFRGPRSFDMNYRED